ncbi:hypothetical protein GCM10023235_65400 [Kitasatospora terrestris]|uniref:Phosphatidic acid phosphatase type 2/haloperoxidase domain-containing protein n=1 Tax=Kitasatospora terrestris TaxID=258051 RepID=A0ABP9EH10_9ACTN
MPGPALRTRRTGAVVVPLLLFAVLAVLLAARDWAPLPAESALHDWSVAHRPAWAVSTAEAVTVLGAGVAPYLAAAAAGLLLARPLPRTPRRPVLLAVGAPVLVLAAGQLVRNGLMHAFARPRPPVADWIGASPSGWSFPSGHAFTAALAGGLLGWALLRGVRRAWTGAVVAVIGVVAAAVGATRVYLGVHWPLDILGGWLLAAGWLALTVPLLAAAGRTNDPDGRY